ncbi:hypothetical protein [Yersinia phage MHG19]|nr:hypothetical protein [Yersinia phage MHG19]
MDVEIKQNLKGLMYEVEISCIQYGMANETYQSSYLEPDEQRVRLADKLQEASDKWGVASKNLYDYLESL